MARVDEALQSQLGNVEATYGKPIKAWIKPNATRSGQPPPHRRPAVQETLWAASRGIKGFRGSASVATWIFTIVRNYCVRLIKREPVYADLDDVLPTLAAPRTQLDDEVVTAAVSRCGR